MYAHTYTFTVVYLNYFGFMVKRSYMELNKLHSTLKLVPNLICYMDKKK